MVAGKEEKVVPAQRGVFVTHENHLKANPRFFSGSLKPGSQAGICHPEVVASCQGHQVSTSSAGALEHGPSANHARLAWCDPRRSSPVGVEMGTQTPRRDSLVTHVERLRPDLVHLGFAPVLTLLAFTAIEGMLASSWGVIFLF